MYRRSHVSPSNDGTKPPTATLNPKTLNPKTLAKNPKPLNPKP